MIRFPLAALAGVAYAAESPLEETRSALREWVETERLISREAGEWRIEHALLEDLITLREQELRQIEAQLADLRAVDTEAEAERARLLREQEQLAANSRALADLTATLETELRVLQALLPDPLRQSLDPLFQRLGDAEAAPGRRLQVVVGLLEGIEQFNADVHVLQELRKMPDGRVREVSTLYFGLGGGFYVDGNGSHAGRMVPTATGWIDVPAPEWAAAIQTALDVHQRSRRIDFTRLPFGEERK